MGSLHVPGDLQACQGRAYGIAMVQDAHSESTLKLESCTWPGVSISAGMIGRITVSKEKKILTGKKIPGNSDV